MTSAGLLAYFTTYNPSIWPMQVVVYGLALAAVFLAIRKSKSSDRIIPAVLALFWLWIGIMFFRPVAGNNSLLYVFATLFLFQGILFLLGAAKPSVSYRIATDANSVTGIVLIFYGLIGSPLVGSLVGHLCPRMAFVGVFPCPTLSFSSDSCSAPTARFRNTCSWSRSCGGLSA